MSIQLKRVYAPPAEEDGCRVLVDHLWPRGIKKADAALDTWVKEVAPSEGAAFDGGSTVGLELKNDVAIAFEAFINGKALLIAQG